MAFDRLDSVGLAYLWGKLKAFFATKSLVGDTTMGTTATTVTGAIKEHNDLIGSTTMGTTATTLTGAIAEHESDINDLNSNKSNLVVVTTEQLSKTIGTTDTPWEMTANKSGYTAVMWNMSYNYAAEINTNPESGTTLGNGYCYIQGNAKALNGIQRTITMKFFILWVKNS